MIACRNRNFSAYFNPVLLQTFLLEMTDDIVNEIGLKNA